MKRIKIYLLMLLAALTVGSCGSDNDGPGDGGDNGETGGGSGIVNTNKNINVVTPGMPDEITRLEFPKVKGGTSTVIVHETDQYGVNFCTEFDTSKKSQRWSCYAVYKSNNLKGWNRQNWRTGTYWDGKTWNKDPFQLYPKLSANVQPGVNEFSSSSMPSEGITYFQRGHIVASEDRICSKDVNGQTFYMTNMQPQRGEFNTGIWEKMEEKIRSFLTYNMSKQAAHANDTMYVCKGGTIDKSEQILGYTKNRFIVPKYFFAAIMIKNKSGHKAIGFWFEHKDYPSTEKLSAHIVNIAKLEELTGIDFFCNLPDDEERQIENVNITPSYLQTVWKITN